MFHVNRERWAPTLGHHKCERGRKNLRVLNYCLVIVINIMTKTLILIISHNLLEVPHQSLMLMQSFAHRSFFCRAFRHYAVLAVFSWRGTIFCCVLFLYNTLTSYSYTFSATMAYFDNFNFVWTSYLFQLSIVICRMRPVK